MELRPFIHTTATEAIAKLTNAIRSRLKGLEAQILEPSGAHSPTSLVDQTIFVSRVCAYLLAASKPLKQLEEFEISETGGQSFVHQAISNVYRAGLGIWTRFTAFTLSDSLRLALASWLQQWRVNAQPIQMPVDSANQMSIPAQPSPCISQFLLQLMEEVYRVFGHVVSQDVIASLITDVTASALAVLSEFADSHAAKFTDSAAIQFVFDVKYLFSVLRLPKAKEGGINPRENLFALLQKVEAVVDPIDYALVRPVLSSRIAQLMVTSAVMFGVLIKVNPFPEPFPPAAAAAEQKESAAMVVAPAIARIQTLPIKLYPSKKNKITAVEALAKEDMKLPPRPNTTASPATTLNVPPTIGALGGKTKELLGKWGLSYS